MRYEIEYREGNDVMVHDKMSGNSFFGQVVNGYARADNWLAMKQISKALREAKKA